MSTSTTQLRSLIPGSSSQNRRRSSSLATLSGLLEAQRANGRPGSTFTTVCAHARADAEPRSRPKLNGTSDFRSPLSAISIAAKIVVGVGTGAERQDGLREEFRVVGHGPS